MKTPPFPAKGEIELSCSAYRCDELQLVGIEKTNSAVLARCLAAEEGGEDLVSELQTHYQPRFDDSGRRDRFGFLIEVGGRIAGLTMLTIASWEQRCGYTSADILPLFRGRRIAARSKEILFQLGFVELGLDFIEIRCALDNQASKCSLEHTPGLRLIGVAEASASRSGSPEYVYVLTKPEWENHYRREGVQGLQRSSPIAHKK
ncbi:MAG: GNAT family N-acetyltransferase [Desulfuromonadaceae bacterium]